MARLFFLFLFLFPLLCSSATGLRRSDFPPSFLFGAGTSAYQVEGAYLEDNKGLSNWDVFTHIQGKIEDGSNGDVASDHYHRYKEDIEMMHSMGLDSYRFSLSWSRILPKGRFGGVNPAGIKFYNSLINGLLEKGIQPFVTINHYDIPEELQERYGSWLSPEIQEDFTYFAELCFKMFGDRVKHWVTFNEPNLMVKLAYFVGGFPPSHCSEPFGRCDSGNSTTEPYIAAHNMILAHAKAVSIYRNNYKAKQGGSIGITLHMRWYEPLRNIKEDHLAVSRALSFDTAWFLDPCFFGDYPDQMRQILGPNLPKFTEGEKQLLRNKIDFIGINHYDTFYVKDCIYSLCDLDLYTVEALVFESAERNGIPIGKSTPGNSYVVPSSMEKLVMYLEQRYKSIPLYITENGYAQIGNSSTTAEELINDTERSSYIRDYLTYLSFAIRKGADVRGYFVWSLMDTFEWNSGYTVKYGLCHVDFKSLKRTPKLSAKWYSKFIKGYEQIEMAYEESPKYMVS
ncbi:probable inactive beta-glucosidase 14 isoform X2 [Miscanthus floridulus]|uniref:probable inactive beta-glucosidase 14 isoform X2 n=1 Tax=Miscanthus floridulus TaxID=154761 RepID=UPI00345AACAF